jgi:hypothetical protein
LRKAILIVALIFIAMLAALTIDDLVNYGLSPLDVLAWMVLGLLSFGIVGALREPPKP